MFFYINFSNGQTSWYTAPLALLFLNPSLLWQLIELPFSLLSSGSLGWFLVGRSGGLAHQLFDGLVNVLLFGVLGWVIFKLVKLARERGLWRWIRNALFLGVRGGTRHRTRQRHSPKEKFDHIAKCINKLPLEKYQPMEDLTNASVRELKARLLELKVDVRNMKEKSELIEALLSCRGSTDTSCSICCEDYVSDDDLRILPCGHKFHLQCIDRWFLSLTDYTRPIACPYCNTQLPIAI